MKFLAQQLVLAQQVVLDLAQQMMSLCLAQHVEFLAQQMKLPAQSQLSLASARQTQRTMMYLAQQMFFVSYKHCFAPRCFPADEVANEVSCPADGACPANTLLLAMQTRYLAQQMKFLA